MVSDETEAQKRIARPEPAHADAQEKIDVRQTQEDGSELEVGHDPSSTRFRALFEHALDAILIADDEGRYIDANPAAAELLGVSREELLGKTAADFGPADLDFAAIWQNFLSSEKEHGVFPIYRPDGSVRYAEYAAVPGFLPGRHLSILRDITKRIKLERQREEALHDLRERAKEATLLHRAGQILSDHDKSIPELLEAIVALIPQAWQYPSQTAARITYGDLVAASPNFTRTSQMQGVPFRTGQGVTGVLEVARLERKAEADEEPFLPEEHNTLAALANILQSDLERRQAEQALRRSEAKHRTLFETMAQGVIYHNADGQIVEANPATARIFGPPVEEILKLTPAELPPVVDETGNRLTPDELPARVALRTGQPVHDVILGVYRPDEEDYRWVKAHSIPQFRPGEREPYQVYTTFEDITERKAREAERRRLVQELQALTLTLEERVKARTAELEQRGEQLRAVASALTVAEQRERERISQILHDDLQQLLHAAQLRVMMLEAELDAVENESVHEGVAELDRLNDRALTVARTLTVELRPPVLEGEGLAEAFAWMAGHMERAYGLQVEVIIEDDVEPATNELRELAFQMVRELLFNVVKHAGVEQARLILFRQGNRCALTVADEGSGFDPTLLEQDGNSIGYGLWSIRERLRLFDGSLAIEAAPGTGTRVIVILPCRAASEGKRASDGV